MIGPRKTLHSPESFHAHQCLGIKTSQSRVQATSYQLVNTLNLQKICSESERLSKMHIICLAEILQQKSVNIWHFRCHLRFFHSALAQWLYRSTPKVAARPPLRKRIPARNSSPMLSAPQKPTKTFRGFPGRR